jgi:A/G-specific adenine glycosylase
VPGILDASAAMEIAQKMMMHPKELLRQSDKKHIFTHIQWNMRGYYLEVGMPSDEYSWMYADEIRASTALPTAFRQFWEGVEDV